MCILCEFFFVKTLKINNSVTLFIRVKPVVSSLKSLVVGIYTAFRSEENSNDCDLKNFFALIFSKEH